jgi:MFS family permease
MIQLYGIMAISYLVSTLNGFDSSLMGAINAMKSYQTTFGLTGEGSSTGIIFIIYNLGQIAAFTFCGLLADGYGRRICIFVGCALVLVGTAIQASAHGMGQFIGGRFVLGFGASIASAAGPAYAVELAHPAYRGTMAGMYNVRVIPPHEDIESYTNIVVDRTSGDWVTSSLDGPRMVPTSTWQIRPGHGVFLPLSRV